MSRTKKLGVAAVAVVVAAALALASLRHRGMSLDSARRWLDARAAARQPVPVAREPLWGTAREGDAFAAHAEAFEISRHLLDALGVEVHAFNMAAVRMPDAGSPAEIDALLQQADRCSPRCGPRRSRARRPRSACTGSSATCRAIPSWRPTCRKRRPCWQRSASSPPVTAAQPCCCGSTRRRSASTA